MLIAQIVRTVIQVLKEQGLLEKAGAPPATCRTCGSGWRNEATVQSPGDSTVAVIKPEPGRRLVVTEEMVRFYAQQGKRRLCVPAKAIITPLARETAKDKKMEIIRE